jgi:DNA-binding LacI/PurR family transcriptional regulator
LITIADVAKLANVSIMTVSRVINQSRHVSKETRERVENAINQLGYRPNILAKGLATGRSKLIAYVMSDLSDPFHSLVSKGIENVCFGRGYTVIISDTGSDQRVQDCIHMLCDRQIDGAIFHHLDISQEQISYLKQRQVNCVTIDNETFINDVSSVDSDNYEGGFAAVSHLIEKGHRKIGCITGFLEKPTHHNEEYTDGFQRKIWRDRLRGCQDALKKAGLSLEVLYEGSGGLKQGFLQAQAYMKEIMALKHPPTALYCCNDIMALGALSELLEMKIPVPDGVALVGHDGLEVSTILYPRVTTILQPRYEMGLTAANMLLDLIEKDSPVQHKTMSSSLFQGNTT